MSAECSKCGGDLVYGDAWPIGECPTCVAATEVNRLRAELARVQVERDDAWKWSSAWKRQAGIEARECVRLREGLTRLLPYIAGTTAYGVAQGLLSGGMDDRAET